MNSRLYMAGLIAFVWFCVSAGGAMAPKERSEPLAFAKVEDEPGLPRVLLIGDSISMGYTLPVRALLAGKANVHRPPENCRSTRQTLERIDGYLAADKWDVIHINCGLHDLTLVGADRRGLEEARGGVVQVSAEEYRRNLEQLFTRLSHTGATVIWATTTPVSSANRFRRPADVAAYNAIAVEVAARRDVLVNDLHAFVVQALDRGRMEWRDGVHFTETASRVLAAEVAARVESALAHRTDSRSRPDTAPAGRANTSR